MALTNERAIAFDASPDHDGKSDLEKMRAAWNLFIPASPVCEDLRQHYSLDARA